MSEFVRLGGAEQVRIVEYGGSARWEGDGGRRHALFVAVLLACAVEAVEALTIVLAAGTSRDRRSAIAGVVARCRPDLRGQTNTTCRSPPSPR